MYNFDIYSVVCVCQADQNVSSILQDLLDLNINSNEYKNNKKEIFEKNNIKYILLETIILFILNSFV